MKKKRQQSCEICGRLHSYSVNTQQPWKKCIRELKRDLKEAYKLIVQRNKI